MRKSILTPWTPKWIHHYGFYRQKNNDSVKLEQKEPEEQNEQEDENADI